MIMGMLANHGGRVVLLVAGAAFALGSSATPPKPAQPNQSGTQGNALDGVRNGQTAPTTTTTTSNTGDDSSDLVTFDIQMDDNSDVMPVMRKAAKAYGCGEPKEEVENGKSFFVVQCTEGMLGVVQEGQKITFACEKNRMNEDQCKQFVSRYVEAASDKTAEGGSSGSSGFGSSGKSGFGSSGSSGSSGTTTTPKGKAGFGSGSNTTEDGTQSYTIDLESDDNVIPLFRDKLKKIGCEVPINAGNFIQASCKEGRVYVYQEGKKLTFNCEKMTSEQCGAILDRMQNAE